MESVSADIFDFDNIFDEEQQLTAGPDYEIPSESTSNSILDGKDEGCLPETSSSSIPEQPWSSSLSSSYLDETPPAWQNDVYDITHRRDLIRQIAKLLQDRKTDPNAKWLKELPYKARKLEEQLYKSAPSMEAYVDKRSLKSRLKRVAKAITTQFKGGKTTRGHCGSSNQSVSSVSSTTSSVLSTGPSVTFSSVTTNTETVRTGANFNDNDNGSVPNMNGSTSESSDNSEPMSLVKVQQQHAVNQKLQQEILENIRQQQKIMRNLISQQDSSKPDVSVAAKQQLQQLNNMSNMLPQLSATPGGGVAGTNPGAAKTNKSPFNHQQLMASAQNSLNAHNNNLNRNNLNHPSNMPMLQRQMSSPLSIHGTIGPPGMVTNLQGGPNSHLPNNIPLNATTSGGAQVAPIIQRSTSAPIQQHNLLNTNLLTAGTKPDVANFQNQQGLSGLTQQQQAFFQQQLKQLNAHQYQMKQNNVQQQQQGFHPTMPPPGALMTGPTGAGPGGMTANPANYARSFPTRTTSMLGDASAKYAPPGGLTSPTPSSFPESGNEGERSLSPTSFIW